MSAGTETTIKMKIGILQTGESPEIIRDELGDYDDLFEELLANRGFEFTTYAVFKNELPADVAENEGWLITGSRFGAYEDHAWIAPLESFLRAVYAAERPIIGVCFGHQILAQALGGKVEKYKDGWSVGAVDYSDELSDSGTTLMAWHQDQVTQPPADAQTTGSSEFCQHAMLSYGNKAYTIQAHPEFSRKFMGGLIEARGSVLPEEVAAGARASLDSPLSTTSIADRFEMFLKNNRPSG